MSNEWREDFSGGVVSLELRGMQHAIKAHVSTYLLEQSAQFGAAVDRAIERFKMTDVLQAEVERQVQEQLKWRIHSLVSNAVGEAMSEVQKQLTDDIREEVLAKINGGAK